MNSEMHLIVATTLSMMMTFLFYCSLKETRASGFLMQNILVDPMRDTHIHLYYVCHNLTRAFFLLRGQSVNETCDYLLPVEDKNILEVILPYFIMEIPLILFCILRINSYFIRTITYTIISGWLLGRFCDVFDLSLQIDAITVYFFIWQIIFMITKWQSDGLPLFSLNLYRAWLITMVAVLSFVVYDIWLRYLPIQLIFLAVWRLAFGDVIFCLDPSNYEKQQEILEVHSCNGLPSSLLHYYTWDFTDDNKADRKGERATLGLGDFSVFNYMLLVMLPPLSSITTKICITIGYIIAVHIGQLATSRMGLLFKRSSQPALPLPVITISLYFILLNIFIDY